MVLRLNIKEVDMKRFNLGFKYFGFPEQCSSGIYCLYDEAVDIIKELSARERKATRQRDYLRFGTIPTLKLHYNLRIRILFLLLLSSLVINVVGLK